MNLFSLIERKSGEELSSAILQYLLLRSPMARELLIDLICTSTRVGSITIDSYFSCTAETPTKSEDEKGRIDLLLEADNAIVGIENKFNAFFQKGQPKKYSETVEERAREYTKIRGTGYKWCLIVLAPRVRKNEIERYIDEQGIGEKCFFLAWEDLLERLSSNDQIFDPLGALLVFELRNYVREQIGFSDSIRRSLFDLDSKWEPWGSESHRRIRDALWSLFPDNFRDNYARGSGGSYCGWYFQLGDVWHWYGFINAHKVDIKIRSDRKSLFMLATTMELPERDLSDDLKFVVEPGWSNNGYKCWILNFKASWSDKSRWEDAIQPFLNAVAINPGGGAMIE